MNALSRALLSRQPAEELLSYSDRDGNVYILGQLHEEGGALLLAAL